MAKDRDEYRQTAEAGAEDMTDEAPTQ